MPPKSVLIVDDQVDLAEMVRFNLEREGFRVHTVDDGAAALVEIGRNPPDLILLDRMLPGCSGDEILTQLRRSQSTAAIKIIMMTAKAEEADELVGFALGADDYVAKPFSMKLMVARVRAMLKRMESAEVDSSVLCVGPLRLDTARHELTIDGQSVTLTATEFRLLKMLITGGGRVFSRGQLIDSILGRGVAVTDRVIDVHVTSLRRKLGVVSDWLQTVRGVGYTFRKPEVHV